MEMYSPPPSTVSIAIKEKNNPGVFVLPIRLEAKFDFHALVDTGSNINVMPYRIYEKLGREKVKLASHRITMLYYSKAELMGILKDVLCQVDRALALQEALNPFKKICVWKKAIAFLGSLPVPLQHAKWIPNRSGNFAKEAGDGKWHAKIRVVDPYRNIFEQGYETKTTNRKLSEYYKLSDIMSPNWI
ncbi:agenet domain-containing protein [Tanacetum coccineum]